MARTRSTPTAFNLSMLDVIACGLGAMVLLFITAVIQIRNTVDAAHDSAADAATIDVSKARSRISELENETRELEKQAEALRNKLRRSQTYSADLASERDRLRGVLERLTRPKNGEVEQVNGFAPENEIQPIEVSVLEGIQYAYGAQDSEKLFFYYWEPELSFGRAAAKAGIQKDTALEILAVDGLSSREPEDLLDALASRDPGSPVEIKVRQKGMVQTLQVRLGAHRILENEPLPLPADISRLRILVQSDRYLGRHLAAVVARILHACDDLESLVMVRLGNQPLPVSLPGTEGVTMRDRFGELVQCLPLALTEDDSNEPDLYQGLRFLWQDGPAAPDECTLVVMCRSPAGLPDSFDHCLKLAREKGARVCGIAVKGRASGGLAQCLALLAEQTGGGFLGIKR